MGLPKMMQINYDILIQIMVLMKEIIDIAYTIEIEIGFINRNRNRFYCRFG